MMLLPLISQRYCVAWLSFVTFVRNSSPRREILCDIRNLFTMEVPSLANGAAMPLIEKMH